MSTWSNCFRITAKPGDTSNFVYFDYLDLKPAFTHRLLFSSKPRGQLDWSWIGWIDGTSLLLHRVWFWTGPSYHFIWCGSGCGWPSLPFNWVWFWIGPCYYSLWCFLDHVTGSYYHFLSRGWSTSGVKEHTPWSTRDVREHTHWSTSGVIEHTPWSTSGIIEHGLWIKRGVITQSFEWVLIGQ